MLPSKKTAPLSPEQQARLDAFGKLVEEKQKRWDRLSPEQQRSEEEAWERAMQTVNEERRGYHRDYSDLH